MMLNIMKIKVCLLSILILFSSSLFALNLPLTLFPLDAYNQNVDYWLPPDDPNYKTPLVPIDYQTQRLKDFYKRTFSTSANALSPWSENFVTQLLANKPNIISLQEKLLTQFSNANKTSDKLGYGENYRPYSENWIKKIADNIDLSQLNASQKFPATHRAIVIKNTAGRLLPTQDPYFYHAEIPGEGYPFDALQESALWVGTPVNIIATTKDHAWSLIIASSFYAWVKSDDLADVAPVFVYQWEKNIQQKSVAVTYTEAPIIDARTKKYMLSGYVGAIFPLVKEDKTYYRILIPVKNSSGYAEKREAFILKDHARAIPLPATRENFAMLLKILNNRPYGWGGMYFYNDCSQELQNLFTPFGIFLPRNTKSQFEAGLIVDKSADAMPERLSYLLQEGHPLMTLGYMKGHVFLYLGTYPDAKGDHKIAMTYQNIWGLAPKDKSSRSVIGQSVLLPLLEAYPEDPNLNSLVNRDTLKFIFLDQMPNPDQNYLRISELVD